MKQNKAFKFRLYPTIEQVLFFNKTFGCCRFVYNTMLSERKESYISTGKSSSRTPTELRKAENQKEAEAEAAYSIAEEEQRKTKENVTADANAVKAKREIEIRRDVLVSERNNEEDAKLYAAQQEAKAIRAVAEANAEAKKLEAEAEAKKVEMIGQAEADALYKKAEAMKQYGDGNQAKLVADTTKTLTQLDSGLNDALGIDIKSMISQFMGTKLGVQSAVKNIDNEETVVSDDNSEADNMNEE